MSEREHDGTGIANGPSRAEAASAAVEVLLEDINLENAKVSW